MSTMDKGPLCAMWDALMRWLDRAPAPTEQSKNETLSSLLGLFFAHEISEKRGLAQRLFRNGSIGKLGGMMPFDLAEDSGFPQISEEYLEELEMLSKVPLKPSQIIDLVANCAGLERALEVRSKILYSFSACNGNAALKSRFIALKEERKERFNAIATRIKLRLMALADA